MALPSKRELQYKLPAQYILGPSVSLAKIYSYVAVTL